MENVDESLRPKLTQEETILHGRRLYQQNREPLTFEQLALAAVDLLGELTCRPTPTDGRRGCPGQ